MLLFACWKPVYVELVHKYTAYSGFNLRVFNMLPIH
jgi:hypothetical protein